MKILKKGKKKAYKIQIQKSFIKKNLEQKLNTTPLCKELILLGAFLGDHYKWTHFSQTCLISGYRNLYSFYDIELSINLLTRATKFLKTASKKRKLQFVFVGNPRGSEEESGIIFKNLGKTFFPNEKWQPGFFSKKPPCGNYLLVIYNINLNKIAFQEAVNSNIPVVGFASPKCDIRNLDYPVVLNLKNNKMWYPNFCKALFVNDTKFR